MQQKMKKNCSPVEFFLILGTRFSMLGTQIGSLKHLKKTCKHQQLKNSLASFATCICRQMSDLQAHHCMTPEQ